MSIVIPSKNAGVTIENCLKSIKRQTYPNIEILLVDNHSTDNTRVIAQKYGVKIHLKGPERTSQINYGAKKANGKYIYRVDSDFILQPSVVVEAVMKCEEHGYEAIAIHNTSDPTISFWSKVRKLERDCFKDDELNIAARFIRRDVFEAIGGFDESLLAAEDYDFHNRLLDKGYKIGRIKSEEVHIGEPRSLSEVSMKHYYYGKTIWKFLDKNRERGKYQLYPMKLSYVKHWRAFLVSPSVTLGFLTYQFIRYVSAGIGCLVGKASK